MLTPFIQTIRGALAVLFAASLLACGGGGVVNTGVQLRPLDPEVALRDAVSYSPYVLSQTEPARASEVISKTNIKSDLDKLLHGGFKLIRLFDSSDKVARQTLEVIAENQLDMKVILGTWIAPDNDTFNQAEIARAVALANDSQFKNIVVAVSVGNETMVSWSDHKSTPAQMAAYITATRNQIKQPVTTDDDWAFYAEKSSSEQNPKAVLDAVDFISIHVYPLSETIYTGTTWDWQQLGSNTSVRAKAMMDAALAATVDHYAKVRANVDARGYGKLPIVIGEAGWKAVASRGEYNRASPVNQKMYFDGLQDWVSKVRAKTASGPVSIVYFQAFDEDWKGSDDKWGLFNKNREARCAIQSRYAQAAGFGYESFNCNQSALYAPTPTTIDTSGTRFTVYANAVPSGATAPVATGTDWFGMDPVSTAAVGEYESDGITPVVGVTVVGTNENANGIVVNPRPNANNWGWGTLVAPANGAAAIDLTAFEATGNLNFSIKTTYQGKLEFGFIMGSGDTTYTAFMPIEVGDYNYNNNGQWVNVSIPIREIKKFGARGYDQRYLASSVYNISKVTNPFVILDDWAATGNTHLRTNIPSIYIDNIYWSR